MPPSAASVVDHERVHGWQRELASAVRDTGELLRLLGLPGTTVPDAAAAFPLLVPRGFVARMRHGDPRDPLLLQVLPTVHEDDPVPGYTADPLREGESLAAPGLVRKYEGRALLLVSGACAVHCRYCFRRDFPYGESGAGLAALDAALDVVSRDAALREVILSGGDPLLLDDVRLGELVERIEALPHVRRLRIHTRLPIVLPERVTNGLVAVLRGTRLRCVVVVHANHPAEIDETVVRATDGLRDAGATLLNQSVLLAGVNDSVEVLGELSERLVENGILPYYLHLLDRVRGAAHFDVAESRALHLIDGLRRRLPGYAVPRLAREVPGDPAKLVIG